MILYPDALAVFVSGAVRISRREESQEMSLIKKSFYVAGGIVVGFGAYVGLLQLTGNFHEVVAGTLYRSSQPTPSRIENYQKLVGIRSIINLRGENRGRGWYDREINASKALGIAHYDFRMSSKKSLTARQTIELVSLLRNVEKPVLVHCAGGADRTGLVSVLYMTVINGQNEDLAERQLSPYYGHIPIPFLSSAYAMDESWEEMEILFGVDETDS